MITEKYLQSLFPINFKLIIQSKALIKHPKLNFLPKGVLYVCRYIFYTLRSTLPTNIRFNNLYPHLAVLENTYQLYCKGVNPK